QFIVSPGLNPAVVEYCLEQQIPIIPGVNDPSAIEAALGYGLQTLKFFPAEASGGAAMVKALAGPFGQVKFVPTGGIHAGNLSDYAVLPNVLAVGGSWMVPGNAVQNQDWDTIRKLCITAVQLLHGFSFAHVGINARDEQDGAGIAGFFNQLGIPSKEGASSYFASDAIEIMKQPYRGRNGHIAIRTHSIDRALPFLAQLGYSAIDDSAKYVNGKLKAIYLQPELGGFALHLLQ
ncbi:MAG: bifunctional 4-hydroxy-2-oxoglutarate aldolase/2-dehydro-3-deoxy-phosphogluconate aldolase, partial [Spirochaeta sp.]